MYILTSVLPQVLLEVAKMAKVLFTVFTNVYFLLLFLVLREFFCVKVKCVDVLLQGAFPRVSFATVVAHVRLLQRAEVCFQVLLEVVVQLEAAVTLGAAKHVVFLGNLHLNDLYILQYLGGSHRFLLIYHFLLNTNQAKTSGVNI